MAARTEKRKKPLPFLIRLITGKQPPQCSAVQEAARRVTSESAKVVTELEKLEKALKRPRKRAAG